MIGIPINFINNQLTKLVVIIVISVSIVCSIVVGDILIGIVISLYLLIAYFGFKILCNSMKSGIRKIIKECDEETNKKE
ncbi:hypothetical protein LCGC14_2270740 [marine sediment metagenome]|uniref:Uncharacterized protein n=1 Tax=marine sediment metagenome TaxID=412755 RepID=A0A0F9CX14_9ZZZZ